ncbi:MAG: hypothetical protein AWU57_333 [Marinobacter sp. T13-3]|nr:MAG: hypothetical protein AWU57_333 [Marinobacter sp. T13-3]
MTSIIATVTLHTRLPEDCRHGTEQLNRAAASDGISEIMNEELMRLNVDKHLLADWTGNGKTRLIETADNRGTMAEWTFPVELCLNIEAPENKVQRMKVALHHLEKLLDDYLHNDSVLVSWVLHATRPGLHVTCDYEEGDAWAFPEYRAAFLQEIGVPIPSDHVERYIEEAFIAGEMTAQKAARLYEPPTPTTPADTLKAASRSTFEAKATQRGLPLDRLSDDKRYESLETEHAWQGWCDAIDWLDAQGRLTHT